MALQYHTATQNFRYNPELKIVKTSIDEPFYSASKKLGWKEQSPGIGINEEIIKIVLKTNSILIVYLVSTEHDYFIKPDVIKQFMKNNAVEYRVGQGTIVIVLPLRKFKRSMFDL